MLRLKEYSHYHLIGIGGCGMSAVAKLLHSAGFSVSGSDASNSHYTKALEKIGIPITIGQSAQNIPAECECVIISSAIAKKNPERQAAEQRQLPLFHRADVLCALIEEKKSIVVVGAHGKTTTTTLIASIFQEAGLFPSYAIGGEWLQTKTNAELGVGDYFIIEADESDASFLKFSANFAVITNVDAEHMECYHHDLTQLYAAYEQFMRQSSQCFLNASDVKSDALKLLPHRTFAIEKEADFFASNIKPAGLTMQFALHYQNTISPISLNLPGQHNVSNALAAIAVALSCGIAIPIIQRALATFQGVGRRFNVSEKIIRGKSVTVINDYGHHPAEVVVTIRAIRQAYPNRRLVLVFQPHRYTRTRDHFAAFVTALSQVDVLLLLEVYSAGEALIPGATSADLIAKINMTSVSLSSLSTCLEQLAQLTLPQDVILFQGAGDVYSVIERL